MRIRQIKPDFWKHDGLGELSRDARLLFIGLWGLSDCEGRLDDRPKRIKAEIFPYDDITSEDVNRWLNELAYHTESFIIRYQVNGECFIAIPAFREHQKLMGNESTGKSNRPSPVITDEKPEVKISSYSELPGNSHTEDRSNGLTEERTHGQTVTARALNSEFSEWAQKGHDFIVGLQMPNLHNLNGVLPWLSKQFDDFSTTRPDLKPEHLLECWMAACESGANKNVSSLTWIKTAFQGKVDAFKPKTQTVRPAAREKPKSERVLEAWKAGGDLRWSFGDEIFTPEQLSIYEYGDGKPQGFQMSDGQRGPFHEFEII
jgi:hypothetical protein